MPETNAELFERLERAGVLSTGTSETMQEAAGFRNVLAHDYGHNIDDDLVYRHLQQDLEWFVTFLNEVRQYIHAQSENGTTNG